MIPDDLACLIRPASGQCGTAEEVTLIGIALPVLLVLSPILWVLGVLIKELVFGSKGNR